MTERVKIGPRVPEPLWNRMIDLTEEKHGKKRGRLSDEVETALKQYVDRYEDSSKSPNGMGQSLQLIELYDSVENLDAKVDHVLISQSHTSRQLEEIIRLLSDPNE